jgi:hypothetical protein
VAHGSHHHSIAAKIWMLPEKEAMNEFALFLRSIMVFNDVWNTYKDNNVWSLKKIAIQHFQRRKDQWEERNNLNCHQKASSNYNHNHKKPVIVSYKKAA